MKVKISYGDTTGSIQCTPGEVDSLVVHLDNEAKRQQVIDHLTTKRLFLIPETPPPGHSGLDYYREDIASPLEGETYFDLALCTLFAATDVQVFFDH